MRKRFFFVACALGATVAISRGQTTSTSTSQTTAPNQPVSAVPAPSMVSIYEVPPITADAVLSSTDSSGTGQPAQVGHYYRSHDGRAREDLGSGSVIMDKRAGTITTLNATTEQAIITSAPGPKGRYTQTPTSAPSANTPVITDLGPSTVEGHPVVRIRVTTNPSTGAGAEVWTASDLRLVVFLNSTADSGQTTTRQYQNIQSVEPDPSLFTIPQGYTIIDKTGRSATATAVEQ